jgi:N-acetylneuraminic acid mutarotase
VLSVQPGAGNTPGSRYEATGWTDSTGNFWLFGGIAYDASGQFGYLNDLWEFNPSVNEWAWMGGSNLTSCPNGTNGTCGLSGVYGAVGTPATTNNPGARASAATWADHSGNLWLFGGLGFDSNNSKGWLSDFWKYQPLAPASIPSFPFLPR